MKNRIRRKTFPAATQIFQQDELGDCAYVIESGKVAIWSVKDDKRVVKARLGKGCLFGETALIGDERRETNATAVEETTVVILGRDWVESKVRSTDPLLQMFLWVMMRRLRYGEEAAVDGDTELLSEALGDGFYGSKNGDALRSLKLEEDLRLGLDRHEFEMHYQPIVQLRTGTVVGFEALMRWRHPQFGYVPPSEFIPVAEATGDIVPLGLFAMEEACRALNTLQEWDSVPSATGPSGSLFMSVNVSSRQFMEEGLVTRLEEILEDTGVSASSVKLEITESLLMEDPDLAVAILEQIKQLGFKLVIDDFGTGYSSLSYLSRFPIDTLKLDRSFVSTMLTDQVSMKIVRAVARLAQDLDVEIVAEGIERQVELSFLRKLGFPQGQGYLFSKPVSISKAARLLVPASCLEALQDEVDPPASDALKQVRFNL